ncbi:MAG: hypothetical protein HYV35_09925 [Lentisphaerae bacterium]|nr:hypothetical protein [Lentisphaerota bacterium]
MAITDAKGRDAVRELARRVAEFANSKENARRRRRWADVNSLRKPDRPPVICHPGSGAWEELLPRTGLVATDPWLADIEYHFRQMLFKLEIGDDTTLDPWMAVYYIARLQGEHFWGLPIKHIRVEDAKPDSPTRDAWAYEAPLKEEADIARIRAPRYTFDAQATQLAVERMQELLGDIMPARVCCGVPGPGAWLHGWATELRGVEQLLVDLMDRPAWVHQLMRTLMEGFLGVMDQFEKVGVLSLNNTGWYACDDLPAKGFDAAHVRLKDLWGRGESQEFQPVGPAQFEEFLLQYQKPILARFGLGYYGCCEDLTNKIHLVLSIPNLRKFVSSPWTSLDKLAAAVGDRYCIEWRQKATDVVFASDLSAVRAHLERGLTITRNGRIMVVLQELETVNNNRRRLNEWATLAKDVAAQCAG